MLGQEQDAEDAFQAVFLVLARKAGSIRKRESVGSWLYGVAYRTAMKARQIAARRRHKQERHEPAPAKTESASSEAALREIQRMLDEEVQLLTEKYRAPFVLCCLEGMSKSEAAKELGWKEGTVSGRLARARKQLQLRLARRGVTLTAALTAVAVVQSSAAAEDPAGLAQAAISAALANQAATTPAAASLSDAVIEGMRPTRSLLLAALLVAALLLALRSAPRLTVWHWRTSTETPADLAVPDPDTFVPPPVGLGTPIDTQVAAVAFSPDGKQLVTAGGKRDILGQLKFWDVATAHELHAVSRIPGVRTVLFSPRWQDIAHRRCQQHVITFSTRAIPSPARSKRRSRRTPAPSSASPALPTAPGSSAPAPIRRSSCGASMGCASKRRWPAIPPRSPPSPFSARRKP